MGVTGAWNPWRALRERPHVVFARAPLPAATGGAVYARRPPRAAIIVDPRLGRQARNAALAHELVHDERGGGCEYEGMLPTWHPVVSREENRVHDEVARRLVPVQELQDLVGRLGELDGMALWEIADHFDVPETVAARAVHLLRLMP